MTVWPQIPSAPEWIRTTGLILRRDALYPAELRAPGNVGRTCHALACRLRALRLLVRGATVGKRISRVLSPVPALARRHGRWIISLGPRLLAASSSLPGIQTARAAPHPLFGLAPGGVCRATPVARSAVVSYTPVSPLPVPGILEEDAAAIGGLLSVALSVASRRPAVSRHPALRSSDFPRRPPPER
jgi:hypothetical protein